MGWCVSGAEWMGAWQFDGVGDFPVQYRPSCSSFFFFPHRESRRTALMSMPNSTVDNLLPPKHGSTKTPVGPHCAPHVLSM